jgi:Membrane domain of glycerophosphoryl diester phosphodiesterase
VSDVALRPRSATELIDAAVQLYRQHFVPFLTLSAIMLIPLLVVGVVAAVTAPVTASESDPVAYLLLVAPILFLSVVWYFVGQAAFVVATSDVYLGRELDVMGAVRAVLSRFWPLVGASFLRGLLIAVAGVLSFFLLFIPAIYVALGFFAVTPVVLLEGKGASAALDRSWQLARGARWKIFGTWVIVAVIVIVASVAASLLALPARGLGLPGLEQVISMLANVVVYPFIGIIVTLLYYDQRIRKEGFDIDVMSQAFGEQPAARPSA